MEARGHAFWAPFWLLGVALDLMLEALGDNAVMTWILSWLRDARMGWIALPCRREHRLERHQGSRRRLKLRVICLSWALL